MKKPFERLIPRAPEGEAAPGGEAAPASAETAVAPSPSPSPESLLFPNEKPADAATDGKPAEGETAKPDATAGEWKEYEADPSKSAEENARLKAEHDKTKPAATDPKDVVPEDGKYSLTMPEGVKVDQQLLDALGPEFKDLGLTQSQAQKLADRFIAVQQERQTKQMEGWVQTIQKWEQDAKADKEIGGSNWFVTETNAKRAMKTFGTPELREYLNVTGGGNHPEVIRAFAKVGAMIREDSPASGGAGGASKPAEPAHLLFPNDAPKGA